MDSTPAVDTGPAFDPEASRSGVRDSVRLAVVLLILVGLAMVLIAATSATAPGCGGG